MSDMVSQFPATFYLVLEELKNNNYSIFKKSRKEELSEILSMDYRIVPIEFSNLVLKRLVEKKGKNCPLSLLYFCIQVLGFYFLKENGIEACEVDVQKKKDSLGSALENSIVLSSSHMATLRKGRTEPLETLFHEINHEIQIKKKKQPSLSYCTYEWLQDTLLYAFIGDSYYSTNYERISIERDSKIRGGVLAYRYLQEISPKTAKKMKQRVYRTAASEVAKITSSRCVGFLFTTREELFDNLMQKKPELLTLYPFLSNFYKEDGAKKPLADVLLDYKGMRDQRKYYETRYSKEELKSIEEYKELLSKISFYISFLRNRISSYANTKNDYLSITTQNLPFLAACGEDEWLENERNFYLNKFEKKYVILMHLGKLEGTLFGEDLVDCVGKDLSEVEKVCAANGNLGIFKRTMISIQKIWNQTIKDGLSRKLFLDNPIDVVDVNLEALENNIRK